jgi:hypothetical protein
MKSSCQDNALLAVSSTAQRLQELAGRLEEAADDGADYESHVVAVHKAAVLHYNLVRMLDPAIRQPPCQPPRRLSEPQTK